MIETNAPRSYSIPDFLRNQPNLVSELQQRITELEAENEQLNAKVAQLLEALEARKSADKYCRMYNHIGAEVQENCAESQQQAEELAEKALTSTDTTWLDRKIAEALEKAAKWFEEDGCTLLPSSVECAVELRRMAADLKG